MADSKGATAARTLTPLPSTARGFGIHISATKKGDRIAYANGSCVIVRSLANPAEGSVFWGHRCKVNVAKFSPNGEWVASGDDRGRVLVWGANNQILKNEVAVCKRVLDISWSDDGQRIVAVGEGAEKFGRVFSWDSGNNVGEITGHSKTALTCDFKPGRPYRIVTAGEDNMSLFFTGPPFKFEKSMREHTRFVNCARYSPDGSQFATVSSDSKIFVYEGKTGDLVKSLESKDGHTGTIYSVSWSPDSKQLLTCGGDKSAKVWNVEQGTVTANFVLGNDVEDQQVACVWHGEYLVTVSLSGALNYLDLSNPGQIKRKVMGHNNNVRSIATDPSTGNFYTVGLDGKLCRWNYATGLAEWFTGKGHGENLVAVAVSANSENLITIGLDDKLRNNEVKSSAFSGNALAVGGTPVAVACGNRDGALAAVATAQGKISILRGGNLVFSVEGNYRPTCLSFSQDDTELAVGAEDKKVRVFSVENDTLKEIHALEGHGGALESVNYSRDGQFLVSADKDRSIFVWDRKDYKTIRNDFGWKYHNAKVTSASFSPSSVRIVSCSQDSNVIVWDDVQEFSSGKRRTFELAHFGGVFQAVFWDDENVLSTGEDRAIKLWKLA